MRSESIEWLRELGKPVLITGHTGFKGMWLTLLLEANGIEVAGISLEPKSDSLYSLLERRGRIYEKFLDISDFEALNSTVAQINPSVVFHFAAQSLVLESYRNPLGTFQTNVMGTANLLQAIGFLPEKIVTVVATTDKVYEAVHKRYKYKESDKLQGKDPYSASKVGTESAVSAWRQLWAVSRSHEICSVRAGNVIGGGDLSKDRLVPDLIKAVMNNSSAHIRNVNSMRPWQHVLDPLIGYVASAKALGEGKKLESVNFGPTEDSLTVADVLRIACEEFQASLKYSFIESASNPISLENEYLDLDSSFAKSNLNWSPKWNQEEAISRTFSWWKNVINRDLSVSEACSLEISDFLQN